MTKAKKKPAKKAVKKIVKKPVSRILKKSSKVVHTMPRTPNGYDRNFRLYWHIHHELLIEMSTYPIEDRYVYLWQKGPEELSIRMQRLRPVYPFLGSKPLYDKAVDLLYKRWNNPTNYVILDAASDAVKAYMKSLPKGKDLDNLHKAACHDCPWNGHTLFPPRKDT